MCFFLAFDCSNLRIFFRSYSRFALQSFFSLFKLKKGFPFQSGLVVLFALMQKVTKKSSLPGNILKTTSQFTPRPEPLGYGSSMRSAAVKFFVVF